MLKESNFKTDKKLDLISSFFTSILKEVVKFSKKFPEAEIFINTSEPFLYLDVVYDYLKLSNDEKEYFFGFEYRLNKALKSIVDEDIPYIEVNFVRKIENPDQYIQVA